MNLIFDLQLFADPTIVSGFSGESKEYGIGDVVLSGEFKANDSKFANFTADAIKESTIVGTWGSTPETDAIYFGGEDDSTSANLVGILDGGVNTWNFESTAIGSIVLGKDVKLNLMQAPGAEIDATLAAAAGQKITFGANAVSVNVVTVGSGNQATTGTLALKGGAGDVSLLNGSALEGSTITGALGGAVTLASNDGKANTFNLKGSDSEAFVTVGGENGGTVTAAELSGFRSIVFDATEATVSAGIILSGDVKNSAVSIFGGEGDDTVEIGGNVNASSHVLIDGGEGADSLTLSTTGRETVVLGADHGADSINNWLESKGDITKGNTISLKGAIDTFVVGKVEDGVADVSVDADDDFVAGGASISSSVDTESDQLGVNLITSEDTYSALLVGEEALSSKVGTKFDNFSYIIADSNETLNLGDTNKKRVVLANDTTEKHWDDVNVYQNVSAVISSTAGKSFLVNGVADKSAQLVASGTSDSIWGGANGVGDIIGFRGKKATDVKVFTGAKDGVDTVMGYTYATATELADANAIRFLDGVEHIVAGDGNLTIGADADNSVEVQVDTASTAGNKVAYGFGTGDDKYIAMVDMTKAGNANLTYGSGVSVYIGQGDKTNIKVDSSAKEVKLGWDGGAGYVSIGGIDGAMAADGAVLIGTTDNEQTITGSSRGASSISGGFVADKWTDDNADILIGGGNATKSTTFFVGEQMGRDEILNLSSKDNIVFLGTKYADLVGFNDPETTDDSITFKFANNTIEANLVNGKTMKNLTDVSLYFDDGTYIWNGSEFAKAE